MAFAARNTKNGKAHSSKMTIYLAGIAGSVVALNSGKIYGTFAPKRAGRGSGLRAECSGALTGAMGGAVRAIRKHRGAGKGTVAPDM